MVSKLCKFKRISLLFLILFIGLVSAANWVNDPSTCPATDATEYPGQNCSPTNICGDNGGIAQCYDTSTISAPGVDLNSNSNWSGSFNGGYILDCYASVDAGEPYCDNSGAMWCDRNSTCYSTRHMNTQCENGKWAGDAIATTCQGCRSGFQECDGSILDADGCEVQYGVTSYPGEANAIYDSNQSCEPSCSSGYLDCDVDLGAAGTGCEVQDGGSCTTEYGTSGTYSGCTCVGTKVHYITGTEAVYGNDADENFFWGTMWGTTGYMAILQNATTDKNFRIDVNANVFIDANYTGECFFWTDGTSACTAPIGGASTDTNWQVNGGADFNAQYNPVWWDEVELTFPLVDANVSEDLTVNWTGLQNYPSACSAGDYVHTIADTLTCSTPSYTVDTDTNYETSSVDFNSQYDARYVNQVDERPDTTLDSNATARTSFLGQSWIWVEQIFSRVSVFDLNVENDLNVFDVNVGRNLIVGNDVNVTGDANITGELYVGGNLIVDGNISATHNGTEITLAPDQNLFKMKITPTKAICIQEIDGNAHFGFC